MAGSLRAVARVLIAVGAVTPAAALGGGIERAPSPVVAWVRATEWHNPSHAIPAIALETVPADVPALAALLADGTDPQQSNAAAALAYGAGGDDALAALRASGHQSATYLLPLALGGRGSMADRAELVGLLEQERDGAHTAALTLGALRAREAEPALERAAGTPYATGSAAREALRWMRQGAWNVEALPSGSDEDRIIAAAFRNGIRNTDRDSVFNDEERGGVWIRAGDAWRFRAGGRVADGPRLRFAVVFNAARTRAMLAVDVLVPNYCAFGDEYLLTREGDGWTIRGVALWWIS